MSLQELKFTLLFCLTILLGACSTDDHAEEKNETLPAASGAKVSLSQEQRKLADVKTGQLQYRHISPVINSTGEIDVPPHGMASVSAPVGGYIQESTVVPGAFVKQGQILARLSSPDFISLQQEYLETQSELRFAEQEFDRQQLLEEQNATATKKLQQSESAYQILKARLTGLKARLQLIGSSLQMLEQGNIQSVVSLRAPIDGYVSQVNHHMGQFAEAREVIFELVNQEELHLELYVFEQDIASIEKGQSIQFRPTGTSSTYRGKVLLINYKRNPADRTFTIHGHLEDKESGLKPGMFVEAEILLNSDSLPALPEKAVVYQEGKTFVVLEREGTYTMQEVQVGQRMNGWIEIKTPEIIENQEVILEGASRVFAAIQGG